MSNNGNNLNQYYYRVISLGGDCSVAGSIRKSEYKESSYPFDWTVSKLTFIIDCFNSKFKIFENLFSKCEKSGNGKLKYNNSVYFYHDDHNVSNALKQKYINRAKKLQTLLNETRKNILFIRKGKTDTIKDILKLKEAIIYNYPNLQFRILFLNNIVNSDNYLDENIIYKYSDKECFLYYNRSTDIYKHSNSKKSYKSVYNELKTIKSEKFIQPPHRDDY